jgi:uncharacterized coiled-coil DUF342 family protein
MATMREAWTDERLDDLKDGMHREFGQVHEDNRELRTEIRAVKTELKGEIADLRTELMGEIGGLCTELKGEIGDLRTEMNTGFAKSHAEVVATRSELKGEIDGLRGDLKAFQRNMTVGFIALLVTIIGAIVSHAL